MHHKSPLIIHRALNRDFGVAMTEEERTKRSKLQVRIKSVTGLFQTPAEALCKVWIGGDKSRNFNRTPIARRNLAHGWNDVFEFYLNPREATLIIQVIEHHHVHKKITRGMMGININNQGLKMGVDKDLKVEILDPQTSSKGEIWVNLKAIDFETDGDGLGVLSLSDRPYDSKCLRSNKSLLTSKITRQMEKVWDSQLGCEHLNQVLDRAKTGDIILHSGTGSFARAIQFSSKSIWSHAAIIIRDPSPEVRQKYDLEDHHHVFVLESETSGNTFDKRAGGGVQLSDYEKWIRWYCGDMPIHLTVIRHINDSAYSSNQTQEQMYPRLTEWLCSIQYKSYETSKSEMVKSLFAANRNMSTETFFCSEVVAATLQALELLPTNLVSCNFLPGDLSSERNKLQLALLRNASYLPEIRLKL
eukprot:TRINITY_DN13595_c0_g1_i1.p1 TRINITY_DN13595_c0_g1~~TRINITY_DN13595_c0_g1_i1.p1  ORF type:complete len:428 (-),score=57.01 TRINITY_DN13595_c0_g1_i1:23-1270(-)